MSKYFSDSEEGERDNSTITNYATKALVKIERNQTLHTECHSSLHIVQSILDGVMDKVFESENHMSVYNFEMLSESQWLNSDPKSVIMSSQKFDDKDIEEGITDGNLSSTQDDHSKDSFGSGSIFDAVDKGKD